MNCDFGQKCIATSVPQRIANVGTLCAECRAEIVSQLRGTDATSGGHAADRLPHWFAEAAVSRVARPETVDPGVRFLRANRLHLVPLQRLFSAARLAAPAWCELADGKLPSTASASRVGGPPPALLAAESTVFGEFLVDRYGPTFLQAVGDELLEGLRTEQVFAALPGVPNDRGALEASWGEWLARAADR